MNDNALLDLMYDALKNFMGIAEMMAKNIPQYEKDCALQMIVISGQLAIGAYEHSKGKKSKTS